MFCFYCDWLQNFFPVRDTRPAGTKKYKQVQSEVAGGFSPFGSDLPCQAFGQDEDCQTRRKVKLTFVRRPWLFLLGNGFNKINAHFFLWDT